jgi:hypothetical protein
MLSFVMLSVVMLSVIMLSVIMLSVVASIIVEYSSARHSVTVTLALGYILPFKKSPSLSPYTSCKALLSCMCPMRLFHPANC